MEHGGDAFTLWARKCDLTVEINRILYQLIIGVSFFWWLFHNREYRPTTSTFASSEDPDEMQHNAAFYQGLHHL